MHDPVIKELAELICLNPTWIDLKGQDVTVPKTLHHAICRFSCSPESYQHWVKEDIITDGVHTEADFVISCPECSLNQQSQQIKEMKPFILKALIDQYKVRIISSLACLLMVCMHPDYYV